MNDVLKIPIPIDLGDGTVPIVMVDDDEMDHKLVKRFYRRSGLPNPLLQFLDSTPFLAYIEAARQGEELIPAMVLMDINMPLMNGFETVGAMRSDERFRDLPVVMMLTSSSHPHDRTQAAAAGANGYLLKPYDPKRYLDFFELLKHG
jgi:CheY-like chemotaxis protein